VPTGAELAGAAVAVDRVRAADRAATLSGRADRWPSSFVVRSADPETMRWVRFHLACTFASAADPPPEPEVSIVVSADEELVRELGTLLGRHRSARVAGFTGTYWDVATVDGWQLWYHGGDPGAGDGQVICRTGADRWLVAATGTHSAALSAVRLCRELLRTKLARRGSLALHGGLGWVPGLGGLLFVGPSGAGKTTLALGLAQHGGYVVSTDQTALLAAPGSAALLGVGYPDTNRIGPGTAHRLAPGGAAVDVPLLRAAASAAYSPPKWWLTAVETEVLYAIPSAPCARVDGIVCVRTAPALAAVRTTPEAVADRLAAEFHPRHPLVATFWLTTVDTPQPDPATVDDLLRLVRRTVLVDLAWDPVRHDIGAVRAALAGALAHTRATEGCDAEEVPEAWS
jgi:hypothetical protein